MMLARRGAVSRSLRLPMPVAMYPMTDGPGTTVADATGNGHNLSRTDAVTFTTGPGGRAAIQITDGYGVTDATFSNPTTAATICGWVRPDDDGTAGNELGYFGFWDSPGSASGSSYLVTYHRRAYFGTSDVLQADIRVGGLAPLNTASRLPVGQWAHLALTYDGAAAVLYLNGQEGARLTLSGQINAGGRFTIGADAIASFADVRVYDSALDLVQIATVMNSTT